MSTYSEMFDSLNLNTSGNRNKVYRSKTLNGRSGPTVAAGINKNTSEPEYPDVDQASEPFAPNKNIDALSLLEMRLQTMQINYMKKMAYWKHKKLEVMAENALQDAVNQKQRKVLKELLKRIAEEIKALFQSPDSRLHDVLEKISPHVIELGEEINRSCDKLKELPPNSQDPKTQEESGKLRLSICNSSIDVLNGFISLTNDVSREIKLCVKLEEILEKAVVAVLSFVTTVLARIPLPTFDFNFNLGGLYRQYLYSEIHPETNRIEKFISTSEGSVERARKIINLGKKDPVIQDVDKIAEEIKVVDKSQPRIDRFFHKAAVNSNPPAHVNEADGLVVATP